jgi:hypothetical protein
MANLTKQDVIDALTRLGQLAQKQNETIELVLVGGSLMVLLFGTRESTRDVDVLILAPPDIKRVRDMAKSVASERNWPDDWLNDAAKGFMIGLSQGPVVFSSPGIVVRRPAIEQLLAMKLSAWRDDVDIADARRLLQELPDAYNEVWQKIVPYLQPGKQLKARYAFDDLWEALHGTH